MPRKEDLHLGELSHPSWGATYKRESCRCTLTSIPLLGALPSSGSGVEAEVKIPGFFHGCWSLSFGGADAFRIENQAASWTQEEPENNRLRLPGHL